MQKAVVNKALDMTGYSLCRCLLNEGVEVEAFDRIDGNKQKENKLDFVVRNALFHFHDGAPEDKQFHGVFSEADVLYYFPNDFADQSLHNAIHETIEKWRSLEKIIQPSTFIVLSSSTDVYRPAAGAIDESSEILPVSVKGILSYINESIFIQSQFLHAILRFSEIYSTGQSSQDDLSQSAERRSTGSLHIDDAVEALYKVAESKGTGIYNIAGGESNPSFGSRNSTSDTTTPRSSDRQESPPYFCIEKAKKSFGFSPRKSIQDNSCQQNMSKETE